MKKIDIHQHYYGEAGLEKVLRVSAEQGIERICMSNIEYEPFQQKFSKALKQYPQIIGFGYIQLGIDDADMVWKLYEEGYKGVKVIRPAKNYSDAEYMPIYETAARLQMPVLFHTGTILIDRAADKRYDTNVDRMRPLHLDYIARRIPELKIIGAHLGVPWYNEACSIAYRHENVYFDLSGAVNTLSGRSDTFFETLTYWEDAKEKLLFGTDSYAEDIEPVMQRFEGLMEQFTIEQQEKFYYGNAQKILGLEEETACF